MVKIKRLLSTPALTLLGLLFPLAISFAGPIVVNYSFETAPAGGLVYFDPSCPDGFFSMGSSSNEVPGWVTTNAGSTLSGVFQPGTSGYYFDAAPPAGDRIGYVTDFGSLSQVVGVVEANTEYTLSVDVLRLNSGATFDSVVKLVIGGVEFTATGTTPDLGKYSTYTYTYTATADAVGQNMTIVLATGAGQGDFDNVQLTAEAMADPGAVPEPTTVALMGFGVAGIALFSRRRRQQ